MSLTRAVPVDASVAAVLTVPLRSAAVATDREAAPGPAAAAVMGHDRRRTEIQTARPDTRRSQFHPADARQITAASQLQLLTDDTGGGVLINLLKCCQGSQPVIQTVPNCSDCPQKLFIPSPTYLKDDSN